MLRWLFVLNAVAGLGFGLAFVFIPQQTLDLYGVQLSDAGLYISNLLGAAFVGYGILAWLCQNLEDSEARRHILLGYFVALAVGFIMSLIGQLNNIANSLGWTTVAIYLVLALGFGYFRFIKTDT